jgi:hypothetical protein
MPFPRVPRLSLRRVCLCTLLTTFLAVVIAIVLTTFYIALPMRRAHYLELDYQKALLGSNSSLQQSVRPLVEDVSQIFYWTIPGTEFKTWIEILGLNYDGTFSPEEEGLDAWIFLASTNHDSRQRPNSFSHKWKQSDCEDTGYMCDMYLDAFQRIGRRWSGLAIDGSYVLDPPEALLRWVDCDVSPMLCSAFWGLSGNNLLVHMTTEDDCDFSMLPSGSCAVTWRWIGLPIRQAPWTRQIRIPLDGGGSTVVPAFPSAEEQLWNLMAYDGAVHALDYFYDDEKSSQTWNYIVKTIPQDGKPPTTDGGHAPFQLWGTFRSMVDNPWDLPEWPYENEIRCYIERYADILLGWWDDAAHLVEPRSCKGLAEAAKQERIEREKFLDEWVADREESYRKDYLDKLDQVIVDAVDRAMEYNARKNGSQDGK